MWDVGRLDPRFQDAAVNIAKEHSTSDKWLTFETSSSDLADEYHEFGLNAWFNYTDDLDELINDYTRVVNGELDADGLEAALANSDYARSLGATTYAWTISGDEEFENLIPHSYPEYEHDDVMRVQEAALLAGSGIQYGGFMYDQYIRWSPELRTNWERVLQTVNENGALLPSADRTRVAASGGSFPYAMVRTSKDGKQTALLAYNLSGEPAEVTLDLTGTGILPAQTPIDLYNGGTAAPITGSTYTVSLPAYGFAMLDVQTPTTTRDVTVTFDANGHGEAPASLTVSAGSTVTEPPAPTADGYRFLGWFTDADGSTPFDFGRPVSTDVTAYAKWEAADQGPGDLARLTVTPSTTSPSQGDTITLTVEGFDADGTSLGDITSQAQFTSSVDTDVIDGNTVRFVHG
ncbi:InlB B-repeat-containing protein [Microbacterium aurum]